MSFADQARRRALACAALLETEAQKIDIFRSVDATESARWLRDMAEKIRDACNGDGSQHADAELAARGCHFCGPGVPGDEVDSLGHYVCHTCAAKDDAAAQDREDMNDDQEEDRE